MGQQLSIESNRAYRAATQLSELTSESLAAVVTVALEERLTREMPARSREKRIRRVRRHGAEIRQHLSEPLPSSDHSWLYDEDGLPR